MSIFRSCYNSKEGWRKRRRKLKNSCRNSWKRRGLGFRKPFHILTQLIILRFVRLSCQQFQILLIRLFWQTLYFIHSTLFPVQIPPKPEPKPCTKPEPFRLESLLKHEEEMQREMEERRRMEMDEVQMRIFKAQPILKEYECDWFINMLMII